MEFRKPDELENVFITGGGGYVGSQLTGMLIEHGYKVTVFDTFWYGENVFGAFNSHQDLHLVKGDLRDVDLVRKSIIGSDVVIHLACISNDPSFDLQPDLGKSINFDCFEPLVIASRDANVRRFIYASSSSVYGVKELANVTEDASLDPLTDYSKFKAQCEDVLDKYQSDEFICTTLRPATVCGYSNRQRLDVVVNILTNLAFNNGEITVFGG